METIFIQIASYRDPELISTIDSCINNALYPNNLKFCICWQRDNKENLNKYINDPRFIILDIPYKYSKGVCWARNMIQQYYNGEEYTLQLDSHHRFVEHWDDILIKTLSILQLKGYKKPLITAYLPSYNPSNDPEERVMIPWKIIFDKITEDDSILTKPEYITNWKELNTEVIPAKFYSAHFCFTLGLFCKEVQHDPELYFTGEEINIGARAYTHGYDMFHPNFIVAWHEYTRNNRVKQWDDNKDWWKLDNISKQKNRDFFKNKISNKYNIGNIRTLTSYIKFSGIM